jgi:hypothetical protein
MTFTLSALFRCIYSSPADVHSYPKHQSEEPALKTTYYAHTQVLILLLAHDPKVCHRLSMKRPPVWHNGVQNPSGNSNQHPYWYWACYCTCMRAHSRFRTTALATLHARQRSGPSLSLSSIRSRNSSSSSSRSCSSRSRFIKLNLSPMTSGVQKCRLAEYR